MSEAKTVRFKVYTKKVDLIDQKRSFYTYSTKMRLYIPGVSKSRTDLIEKWVDLKFRKECNVSQVRSGGVMTAEADKVDVPFTYKPMIKGTKTAIAPTIDGKGKVTYKSDTQIDWPTVWVRDFIKWEPYQGSSSDKQSAFVTDDEKPTEATPVTDPKKADDGTLPF